MTANSGSHRRCSTCSEVPGKPFLLEISGMSTTNPISVIRMIIILSFTWTFNVNSFSFVLCHEVCSLCHDSQKSRSFRSACLFVPWQVSLLSYTRLSIHACSSSGNDKRLTCALDTNRQILFYG